MMKLSLYLPTGTTQEFAGHTAGGRGCLPGPFALGRADHDRPGRVGSVLSRELP